MVDTIRHTGKPLHTGKIGSLTTVVCCSRPCLSCSFSACVIIFTHLGLGASFTPFSARVVPPIIGRNRSSQFWADKHATNSPRVPPVSGRQTHLVVTFSSRNGRNTGKCSPRFGKKLNMLKFASPSFGLGPVPSQFLELSLGHKLFGLSV